MAFLLADTVNSEKVFLFKWGELEGRLDCEYYHPSHYRDLALLENSPHNMCKLKDVCTRIVDGPFGSAIKADDYVDDGVPFIRVADVTHGEGSIKSDNLIYISYEAHKEISRSKVTPGDVIIAKTGATMGAASVLPVNIPEANIRGDLAALTLVDDLCSPEFAITYINTPLGQRLFWRLDSGGTRGRVVIGNLKKYPILTPSPNVQAQIVAKMNAAYAAKKQKEAQAQELLDSIDSYLLRELGIELLPEKEDGVCRRMFVRRFSEVSGGRFDAYFYKDIFVRTRNLVSESRYSAKYLGQLCLEITNGFDNRDFSTTGLPYVKVANVKPYQILPDMQQCINIETPDRVSLVENDILLTRKGSFGIAARVTDFTEYAICSEIFKLRLIDIRNATYLEAVLNSKLCQIQFDQLKIGAIMGSLTQDAIRKVLIPLPPLEKQNEIAAHIQTIRGRARQLRAEAAAGLERAKQEVEAMITGRN